MAGHDARKGLELALKILERDMMGIEFDVHPREPWIVFISEDRLSLRVWNYEDGRQVAIRVSNDLLRAKFLAQKHRVAVFKTGVTQDSTELIIYEIVQTSVGQIWKIKAVQTLGADLLDLRNFVAHSTAQSILTTRPYAPSFPYLRQRIDFRDLERNLFKCHFPNDETRITTLHFHPHKSHIHAAGDSNGNILILDAEKQDSLCLLHTFEGESPVTSTTFSTRPRNSLLITGHKCGKFMVWDHESKECVVTCDDAHEHAVVQAFFHPDLPYIISASDDGTIKIWNDSNYQLAKILRSGLVEGLAKAVLCRNDSTLVLGRKETLCFITIEGVSSKANVEGGVQTEGGDARAESDKSLRFERADPPRIKQLETELSTVRAERTALKKGFRSEEVMRVHAQKITELQTKLSNVWAERQTLEVTLERFRAEHERAEGLLSERVKQLEHENNSLLAQRQVLEDKLERSKVRVHELERRLETEGGAPGRLENSSGVRTMNMHPCREFPLEELKTATNDFHDNCKLRQWHYGCVYMGKIMGMVTPVEVKRLKKGGNSMTENSCGQLTRELVDRLRSLRHPHLQMLLGVCYEGNCLVYEHMAKGNVKEWISSSRGSQRGFLPWYVRLRIIAQVAQALSFLHTNQPQRGGGGPIIHRTIKPENICLDGEFVAKITEADMALQPLLAQPATEDGESPTNMHLLPSSDARYLAPEFSQTEVFTQQTDVYAFGITILEILTGKFRNAFGIMEDAVEDVEAFRRALDPNAGSWDNDLALEAARVGLRCASLNRRHRPTMMTGEGAILPSLEAIAQKLELADSL
ncbi:hypothetical protein CBR_g37107 [Chara braunii]|uniref:Protein kinase domain-containing protein n=1 Tax=Chara braunii TaxID=69332 RepID=A0A388LMD5_CHABU|nr:hypothetical protein CBR_g37107 [Chara braunii]|eukprot:GBG83393.1 hypothetical protein CBR_g37107 [Chara braunii]